jgi:hypothetical protein
MTKLSIKLPLALLLGIYFNNLKAQESIVASGNNFSNSSGSVSYSLGQIAYTTNTGSNGTISQGVQQPYEIFDLSGNQNITLNFALTAYPNPTSEFLTLNYSNYTNENANYQILNLEGKLLETNNINSTQTLIDFGKMAAGSYTIKVTLDNKELQVFKILKQ